MSILQCNNCTLCWGGLVACCGLTSPPMMAAVEYVSRTQLISIYLFLVADCPVVTSPGSFVHLGTQFMGSHTAEMSFEVPDVKRMLTRNTSGNVQYQRRCRCFRRCTTEMLEKKKKWQQHLFFLSPPATKWALRGRYDVASFSSPIKAYKEPAAWCKARGNRFTINGRCS